MSRFAFTSFLLLVLTLHLSAADFRVSGYVVDVDGQPVPYAHVSVPGTSLATLCNINGAYSLSVPEGARTIQVSMVGYESETKSVKVASVTKCNFTLHDKALALDGVTVSAKSDNRRLKESFFSVNALDAVSYTHLTLPTNSRV